MNVPSRSLSFSEAAEIYDRARPGYPPEVFDEIISACRLSPDSRLLEIGAGTGKATIPFAKKGYHITALEPGGGMLAVLRKNAGSFKNVECVQSSFEDFVSPAAFNLIFSAHAFHWVDPEIAYHKARDLLLPGERLSLLWNFRERAVGNADKEIQAAYDRFLPPDERRPFYPSDPVKQFEGEVAKLKASGIFYPEVVRSFPFTVHYSAREYRDLLLSYSDTLSLPEAERKDFLLSVSAAIGEDKVAVKYYSSVVIAGPVEGV